MKSYLLTRLLVLFLCSMTFLLVNGQSSTDENHENILGNSQCFKCHGQDFYYYYNDWVERDIRGRMNPYFVFDSAEFYQSNHKNFFCVDCHSSEYETFPHDGQLRMEPKYTCMDCHGGDDNYAHFNFEEIEREFNKSVHASRYDQDFTCWMCHDPHSYKMSIRETKNLINTIAYSNEICLSCHADLDMYKILTDNESPDILSTHKWLPNQALHFANVRCIECHAEINDDLLVAHNIRPKEDAVRKCVDCHSTNTLLMASLYKHQSRESRNILGMVNAAILNEAYVVGANRSTLLNNISLIIFGLVLLFIFGHGLLRIIKK